uniref:Chemosensory protein 18 n=1 Tax=Matsumurasca onukii TaxID=2912585 RepID=A0A343WH00_MATON|nr:chemosensory protein 18 [Matsumurasca onukii]
MMKSTLYILACLLAASSGTQQKQNLDPSPAQADMFLQDREFMTHQLNCVVGSGSCDAIGNVLKDAVVEVLSNNCAKCTAKQQNTSNHVLSYVRQHYPTYYTTIQNMYAKPLPTRGG